MPHVTPIGMLKILIVFLGLSAITATTRAEVAHNEGPPMGASQVALSHGGVDGVWFRLDIAERILRDVKAARLTSDLEALYERKIMLLDTELTASRRLLELAEQGEMRASDALDRALFAKVEAESQRDAWHRSPALWFSAGGLLVIIAVAAGAYAITQ